MATLVTSPALLDLLAGKRQQEDRRFGAFLTAGLTVFAVAVHGYHPYAEDGGLYMAGIKRLIDPSLYPHGTEFVVEHLRFSLFAPAVAVMARAVGLVMGGADHALPAVLFALHLASVWLTLFSAWMLAARCFVSREARAGAVALLACWLDLPVAGTSLLLMDPYVTARSFSMPCLIFALVAALDMTSDSDRRPYRGLALCCLALTLTAALHPLMAVYGLGSVLVLLCFRSSNTPLRRWGVPAIGVAAFAIAALIHASAPAESPAYIRVAMTRPYWFVEQWRWYELLGLIAPLGIVAWSTRGGRGDDRSSATLALAKMTLVLGASSCAIALLFARTGDATHLVARMQPLRVLQIVYLVMILLLGARLGEAVLRRSALRWVAMFALLGGVMVGAERITYPNSNRVELPGAAPRNEWVQAFFWIREHTPKDALFALDADYIAAAGEDAQCFRAVAERSALPDYSKDGGEASITPSLTGTWVAGQTAQASLSAATTNDAKRAATLRPLGVTWVVLERQAVTSFDCPYENAAVKVCRLP